MTRTPISRIIGPLIIGALALGAALTGCAAGGAAAGPDLDLAAEAQALSVVGVDSGLAAAAPDASAAAEKADKKNKPGKAWQLLRRNSLHGELTVQTKQGDTTVAAQRGAVTAVTGTAVTVKSADGFTATWTFGDKLRVRQDRKDAERAAIKTGATVAVAGAKDKDAFTARLVVIKP